jgi:hypothetical protein
MSLADHMAETTVPDDRVCLAGGHRRRIGNRPSTCGRSITLPTPASRRISLILAEGSELRKAVALSGSQPLNQSLRLGPPGAASRPARVLPAANSAPKRLHDGHSAGRPHHSRHRKRHSWQQRSPIRSGATPDSRVPACGASPPLSPLARHQKATVTAASIPAAGHNRPAAAMPLSPEMPTP